ncbi:MAG: hypothetical protein ABJA98_10305 [Acidobacteriota bacterium]
MKQDGVSAIPNYLANPRWLLAAWRCGLSIPRKILLLDLIPRGTVSPLRRFRFVLVRILIGSSFHRNEPRSLGIVKITWSPSVQILLLNRNPFLSRLRRAGLWENEIRPVLTTLVKECQGFLDIGSHDGFYAMVFAKSRPGASVTAVEPDSGPRSLLYQHCWLNKLTTEEGSRIEIDTAFVGEARDARAGVVTRPMKEYIARMSQPGLVKIDIDGGEASALRSAFPLSPWRRLYFVIETHSLDLENECVTLLIENGFRVRIIRNAWWRTLLAEERPIPHNRWLVAWNTETEWNLSS